MIKDLSEHCKQGVESFEVPIQGSENSWSEACFLYILSGLKHPACHAWHGGTLHLRLVVQQGGGLGQRGSRWAAGARAPGAQTGRAPG